MIRFACLLVVSALLVGCKREEEQDAQRALQIAAEVSARAEGPVGWLVSEVERERAQKAAQLQRLDRVIQEVQDLIAKEQWDKAEAKAVEISWTPITGANNDTDKLLVEQYDTKRNALLLIIRRHRGEAKP
jgi:hypothetical protein